MGLHNQIALVPANIASFLFTKHLVTKLFLYAKVKSSCSKRAWSPRVSWWLSKTLWPRFCVPSPYCFMPSCSLGLGRVFTTHVVWLKNLWFFTSLTAGWHRSSSGLSTALGGWFVSGCLLCLVCLTSPVPLQLLGWYLGVGCLLQLKKEMPGQRDKRKRYHPTAAVP